MADRLGIFACSMLKSFHSRLAFPSLDWHMCNGVCVALNTPTDVVLGCIGYHKKLLKKRDAVHDDTINKTGLQYYVCDLENGFLVGDTTKTLWGMSMLSKSCIRMGYRDFPHQFCCPEFFRAGC